MNQEEKLARMIADACLDEKALDVVVLDVRNLTVIADYFVIASGRSMIQVRSIVDHVLDKLQEQGISPIRKEGLQQGVWTVLDYNSVILHVFRQEEREYYQLENLWADAPQLLVDSNCQL
ncbi:MAG TPA: ribosome silencing factor [Syntrophomonadaceae bacterium]|nr:ribosome silencing factor [Syntrophomonadaceae bacterium]HQE22879.1 ribosome silencing factor [Syntrophomonadaceae bacterium]